MSAENLSLKWNDFQENASLTFHNLWQDKNFTDVTLVCEDGHIEAHKIILSAASQNFRKILNLLNNNHPLIYMRGLNLKELTDIVEFIYNGQLNVPQDDLNSFLKLAEELEVKGLNGISKYVTESSEDNLSKKPTYSNSPEFKLKDQRLIVGNEVITNLQSLSKIKSEQAHVNKSISSSMTELDLILKEYPKVTAISTYDAVESKMVEENKQWKCLECGKTTQYKSMMKRHVEIHIDGLTYDCNICGKSFSSRSPQQKHISEHHKNSSVSTSSSVSSLASHYIHPLAPNNLVE